jgi:hypothetical protein
MLTDVPGGPEVGVNEETAGAEPPPPPATVAVNRAAMPPLPAKWDRSVQIRPEESVTVAVEALLPVTRATRTDPTGGMKLAVVTVFDDAWIATAGVLAFRDGVLPPLGRTS